MGIVVAPGQLALPGTPVPTCKCGAELRPGRARRCRACASVVRADVFRERWYKAHPEAARMRDGSAILSSCRTWRYRLWRGDRDGGLLFCGMNPSTADEAVDDHTVSRWRSFAAAAGFEGFDVVNLYDFRTKDPKVLRRTAHKLGPDGDRHLREALARASVFVPCWGAIEPWMLPRAREVLDLAGEARVEVKVLRVTSGGHPGHPARLPSACVLTPWVPGVPYRRGD